ncbi:MAG TPA: hypothetical protein VMR92_02250, partial [Gemmatimonadales bacterium]|nr:hypothetical protein [Gemmatimonadales bacterium]
MMAVLLLVGLIAQQPASLPPAPPPPPPPPAKRTLEFTGTVLMNSFYNSALTNNSDVPTTAALDTLGVTGGSATVRQTRVGALLTDPDVLGGTFTGELDLDFYGGQLATFSNRTFPVLRVRRAIGVMQWTHMQVLVGQEAPLISERNPLSLASIGVPGFTTAGNLWLWIPQIRVTGEYGYTLRLALQGALLAPIAGGVQGPVNTQPDSGERTSRPYIQGRVRLGWGPADDPSEVAIGGHIGWVVGLDSTTGDTLQKSNAVSFDTRLRFGTLEFLGEAYSGQAVAGLGGGAIGQNFGVGGAPVHSKGGWGQLNVRPRTGWMFGGGCGLDDPNDADIPATGRFRNFVCEGHVEWRPGPLVLGFEFRRLETRYQTGDFVVNHLNLATGF